MPGASEANRTYDGDGKLLTNYGWVQNTSNLSTVRDTVELVSEAGMNHNALMRAIKAQRADMGMSLYKWTWDARCRCKAVCATGMVVLERSLDGYRLSPLGKELIDAPKSDVMANGNRVLSEKEIEVFRKGLLSSPPVIRVLSILNDSRKSGKGSMSKYDVGSQLGFVGDIGFTHFEAEYVVRNGKSFNDAEGDADKWARTIISWLKQVNWVVQDGSVDVLGKSLPVYTTTYEVDRVLQYAARSTTKYIPQEMLCSNHHPFAEVIQLRRLSILEMLAKKPYMLIQSMVDAMVADGIDTDEETLAFDILNLRQAGIQISKERSYYRLTDKIAIDATRAPTTSIHQIVGGIEKKIEHYVMVYADSLPTRLVDNLIRYGYDSTNSAALFEMAVDKMFVLMGYGMRSRKQSEERKPSLRTASTLPCRTSSPKMRTPLLRGNSYWSSSLAGV